MIVMAMMDCNGNDGLYNSNDGLLYGEWWATIIVMAMVAYDGNMMAIMGYGRL
jgi:hypothetical protein